MIVRLDASHRTPPYQQIVEQVSAAVTSGELAAWDRLPPIRQLATDLAVAPGTVARAYRELEQAGLVVTRGRRGTFVLDVGEPAAAARWSAAELITQSGAGWDPAGASGAVPSSTAGSGSSSVPESGRALDSRSASEPGPVVDSGSRPEPDLGLRSARGLGPGSGLGSEARTRPDPARAALVDTVMAEAVADARRHGATSSEIAAATLAALGRPAGSVPRRTG